MKWFLSRRPDSSIIVTIFGMICSFIFLAFIGIYDLEILLKERKQYAVTGELLPYLAKTLSSPFILAINGSMILIFWIAFQLNIRRFHCCEKGAGVRLALLCFDVLLFAIMEYLMLVNV